MLNGTDKDKERVSKISHFYELPKDPELRKTIWDFMSEVWQKVRIRDDQDKMIWENKVCQQLTHYLKMSKTPLVQVGVEGESMLSVN
jgi:hypothetical protein